MIPRVVAPLTLMLLAFALGGGLYANSKLAYFPPELFSATTLCRYGGTDGRTPGPELVLPEDRGSYLAGTLNRAAEPSLYFARPTADQVGTWRLMWQTAFGPAVIVRVDEDGSGLLHIKARQLGRGYSGPDTQNKLMARTLTPAEAAHFKSLLASTQALQEPGNCDESVDGSYWLIEARTPEGYRFLGRRTPADTDPVKALGLEMRRLTGWTFATDT